MENEAREELEGENNKNENSLDTLEIIVTGDDSVNLSIRRVYVLSFGKNKHYTRSINK